MLHDPIHRQQNFMSLNKSTDNHFKLKNSYTLSRVKSVRRVHNMHWRDRMFLTSGLHIHGWPQQLHMHTHIADVRKP
jgi:hypothetical protein